ncbi:MAG TPA: molybdopterin cofactor-binding domain-containing protein, partial [Candidatus Binatia bacterium]|nr:molybdopterin cofactor-binding domain-containing protein [Candidatus Binatia bacterium]
SRTTPHMNLQLRKVAAAARETLLELAADKLKVQRASLVAAEGKIMHPPTQRALSYRELSQGRNLVKAIGDVRLKPAAQWQIAGRALGKVAGRDMITGKHRYTADMKLPGMLYGKVLRPAAFHARLARLDTRGAEKLSGVALVHDGDFVGVAAPTEHEAEQALAAIRAEWKSQPQISNQDLYNYLRHRTARSGASSLNSKGSSDGGLEQTYNIAYIAHAPLEPRAAVAEWREGKLTVWTGTQRPFGVRSELSRAFGIAEDRVRVIMPDTGSAYGGKHTGEVAIEAARLARAARRPVKLVWSREEEFTWAYFRPAGVIEIKSKVNPDGTITAWEFHNYNSGSAGIRSPYATPNQQTQFHGADSPLRQGSYRGLAATANHFGREVHIDELAHLVKMDPLAFRLKNLKDERVRAVLQAAAKAFGWSNRKAASGHGHGIACGTEKGGYVASCVEVVADRANSKIRLLRVVTAFECGAIVNPDGLKNQVEGAVIQGIGGALFEAIEFANGKILNPRFSRYRVPRFGDTPQLETILLDRKDLPSAGAGETPIVALAPSVGNAIFDATGVRLRSLPLVPNGLRS